MAVNAYKRKKPKNETHRLDFINYTGDDRGTRAMSSLKSTATPAIVAPTANNQVEELFNSNQSMKTCTDKKGGKYKCPGFVMHPESEA